MAQLGKGLLGRLIGTGVAIVLALGIGFVVKKYQENDVKNDAPQVGDCVLFESAAANEEAKTVACDDAEASHEVVADDGECGPGETGYQVTTSESSSDAVVDLCLVINAEEGDCFDQTDESKVDCAATVGKATVFKIASVGKAGDKCANPGQPLEYTKRDILLCAVPNA